VDSHSSILALQHLAMNTARQSQHQFFGREHHFHLSVYFEDTDFSGVVYHANYLRFMERARSDMLACIGIDQRRAFETGDGVYAVADMSIRYIRPARFGDALTVISTVDRLRAAACIIHQRVIRRDELGDRLLVQATVTAAFTAPGGGARRQPKAWVEAFTPLLPEMS
jgi:acyl-CoA thioester hydrolase